MPGKCFFQESWLSQEKSETNILWLQPVLGDKYKGFCKLCKSKFDISHSGYGSLKAHEKGKKHQELFKGSVKGEQRTLPFRNIVASETTSVSSETASVSSEQQGPSNLLSSQPRVQEVAGSSSHSDGKIRNYFVKDEVTKAEIVWAMNKVMNHYSDRSSGKTSDLFPVMFPDSIIAQQFKLHKDKIGYIITYGLGPYFQSRLAEEVNKCDFFCVSFDESLNKVAQKGQMDIVVRYWNSSLNQVSTCYLTSTFLGHSTTIDLLNAFSNAISNLGLSLTKIAQIQCDGPNVNIKFLKDFEYHMKLENHDAGDNQFIDVGTCTLHIIHGSYKTAHNACGWHLNDFLRAIYYLFKDFPSRRADYKHHTGSSVFPLKLCSIRWVENSKVIERAIAMLPYLKQYVEAVKSKPPATKNYNIVAKFLGDNLLHAKLAFLQSAALELEPFLTKFQSNDPLLPFLYPDLYSMMRCIADRFIKKDVMKNVKNASQLLGVDVQKQENIQFVKTIDIGFGAAIACKSVKEIDVLSFRKDCRDFLVTMYNKLNMKSPLRKKIVKGASCLSPEVALSSLAESRMTCALEEMITTCKLAPLEADKAKKSYIKVRENPTVKEKLQAYSLNKVRLDSFWTEAIAVDGESHNEFLKFCHIIFTLFHGNAEVERGFSVNKECLVENLHEDSLIALRSVFGAVSAAGNIKNIPITKAMIIDVRRASSKRQDALKHKRSIEDNEEITRKRVAEDLKILQRKKKKLVEQTKEEVHSIDEEISKLNKHLKK